MNENKNSLKRLTVISPVYNEELVVPLFFERMKPVVEELSKRYNVDLLFLNNSSTDRTYETIDEIRSINDFVYVITLSSNVGYQRSLECGLHHAKGDIIAFIDVDCEDPPEMILDFIASYESGYDLVYGERVDREEMRIIKLMRKVFYRLVKRVADEDIILYMAEFSLFTSEVRDAIVQDHSSFPFIRSSLARVGFHRLGIPYKRSRRIAGETHYNLLGMTIFAVASILSSTTLPLRLPIYFFPFWLLATLVLGIAQIVTGNPWYLLANVMSGSAFFGATLSFVAIYVARTYKNGLGRPNYAIHRRLTFLQTSLDE